MKAKTTLRRNYRVPQAGDALEILVEVEVEDGDDMRAAHVLLNRECSKALEPVIGAGGPDEGIRETADG